MSVNRSNMASLMAPGLRAVFFDKYNEHPKMYEQLFDVRTTARQFEVSQGITGFGLVAAKPEGTPVRYDDPLQGFNVTYIPQTYALGYRITEEAYEDDQYKILGPKMSAKLSDAAYYTREIQGAAVFNNGFGDTGPDGVSLFNVAHPLVGGGFSANRPATPAALSQTSLQAALTTMRRTVNDRGYIIRLRPAILMVAPELEFYATELVQSMLKPDSQNNNVNAMYQRLDVMIDDFLTSPTAWYVLAEKDQRNLVWYDRRKLRFKDIDDFDTGDSKFVTSYRSTSGYDDWRGVYGSPGS